MSSEFAGVSVAATMVADGYRALLGTERHLAGDREHLQTIKEA